MTRILSAAVLLGGVVVTIWFLPWWATAVMAALVAGAAGEELAGLAASLGAAPVRGFVGLSAAVACAAFVLGDAHVPAFHADALAGTLIGVMLASGLVGLASGPPSGATFTRVGVMALVPLYVGLPLGAVAWLRAVHGPEAISWLILVIAGSDSAQYYTGRAFGRRKLAPAVSPAKTVEGAVGGLVVAVLAGAAASHWWLPGVPVAVAGALALVLAAIGISGDLFESMIKRSAGAKDSSALIPGHGGILDRIDSYLFAAPLLYLFMRHLA